MERLEKQRGERPGRTVLAKAADLLHSITEIVGTYPFASMWRGVVTNTGLLLQPQITVDTAVIGAGAAAISRSRILTTSLLLSKLALAPLAGKNLNRTMLAKDSGKCS